jgi:hypothetical protein
VLYSQDSNFSLNNLTLRIKDLQTRKEYDKKRIDRYNSLAYYCLSIALFYFAIINISDALDSEG